MIKEELFKMQDKKYRDFQSKLMPTVNPDRIIGVRTPELRKYAKQIGLISSERYLNEEAVSLPDLLIELRKIGECIKRMEAMNGSD